MEEKDLFLYYFLKQHPGKTLVFCNSIDGIRRLVPILELLKVKAWGIHSKMQQRQRLKNIDRFKATKDSVLVASDVASRGIDIADIQHVVHFQLPRSMEIFIHRSGRTARSGRSGAALSLISPEETSLYKKLSKQLQSIRMNSKELEYSVSLISKMKQLVVLSRKINELEHQMQKSSYEKTFETKAANELGLNNMESDDSENPKKSTKGLLHFIKNQKNILNSLLADENLYLDASIKFADDLENRNGSNDISNMKRASSVVGHFSIEENVIENAILLLKKKQRFAS